MTNKLFYGDNLDVLREHIRDESVDLVYLDPPFNSAANYNVLFRSASGEQSQAQIEAFEDTWHWNDAAESAFADVEAYRGSSQPAVLLRAMRSTLGDNDMMAYLAMMSVRLIELHRVLKNTGAIYLHCDPAASHYLKIVMDAIFDRKNFRSEIVWRRSGSHNSVRKQFGPVHDCILFYARSKTHRLRDFRTPYTKDYIKGEFTFEDKRGFYRLNEIMGPEARDGQSGEVWRGYNPTAKSRHWAIPESLKRLLPEAGAKMTIHQQLDALFDLGEIYVSKNGRPKYKQRPSEGVGLQDIWAFQPGTAGSLWESNEQIDQDVKWLTNEEEKLGYPTQKPIGLLRRIIESSSNQDDVVLDPFCGCGTTIHAAQKLGRQWLGIDVTHLAISLIERRLKDAFPGLAYEVIGTPRDLAGARDLAKRDPYQFQWWATSLIDAVPAGGKKKGMDRGIDGYLNFRDAAGKPAFGIVSVKGGESRSPDMIRVLKTVVDREKAALGVFISLAEPTREMVKEAASAGFYETGGKRYPKLQMLTIAQLFDGRKPEVPFGHVEGFRKAGREKPEGSQGVLF